LPMIAVLGVTVMVGEVKAAVTVVLAFIVTLQVTVVADVHPDHELKLLFPAVAGAPKTIVVPELSVSVNVVVPVVRRLVTELP